MFGIVDIVVTLGGLFIGLVQKSMDNGHQQKMLLLKAGIKDVKDARAVKDEWFKWTRRTIALTVTAYVFVAPVLAAFFNVPISIAYSEDNGFIMSILKGETDFIWKTLPSGLVLSPIHIHATELILGLYFGRK